MGLSPVKRESISEQVYEQIKQMIIDREWELGEKLPSETELGNILGVSRVTVRQALQKLAVLGLVETRLGEGTFVCEANMAARMKASLVPDIYLTPHSTEEVLDFRCAIEVETAGLAARKATAEDIAELKRLLARQLDVENRTPKSFADDDNAFHMTIAKSTGNSLIIATYELLADIFSSAMMHTVRSLGMEIGIPYHKRLVEAIEAHDEHRAIVTMKEHMNTTRDHFLNILSSGQAGTEGQETAEEAGKQEPVSAVD